MKRSDEVSDEEILAIRAEELAVRRYNDWNGCGEAEEYIEFALDKDRYVVRLGAVSEVLRSPAIIALPALPSWYCGVTMLRSVPYAILNLSLYLNSSAPMPLDNRSATQFVLVLKHSEFALGILVDELSGVTKISNFRSRSEFPVIREARKKVIKGIASSGLKLVDVEEIFSDKDILVDHGKV